MKAVGTAGMRPSGRVGIFQFERRRRRLQLQAAEVFTRCANRTRSEDRIPISAFAQEHAGVEHEDIPLLNLSVFLSNGSRSMLNKPDFLSKASPANITEHA